MKNLRKNAFTLVEIIVAVTIFSIITISIISIFINTSQISAKIDINRLMQENSKNIIETIAEDLLNWQIPQCSESSDTSLCIWEEKMLVWQELKLWENHYYLAIKDDLLDEFIKINSLEECENKQCFLLKNGDILSNSYVKIKKLQFTLFTEHIPKLQINMILSPMSKKWIPENLIKQNEINIQTTLSTNLMINN